MRLLAASMFAGLFGMAVAGASDPTLVRQFEQLEVRTWPTSLKLAFRSMITNLR